MVVLLNHRAKQRQPLATIWTKVIDAATNFLEQRMDDEQESIMKNIVVICNAKSVNEFVAAPRPLLECAGIIGDDVKEFTGAVFEILDDLKPNSVRILHMLTKHSSMYKG